MNQRRSIFVKIQNEKGTKRHSCFRFISLTNRNWKTFDKLISREFFKSHFHKSYKNKALPSRGKKVCASLRRCVLTTHLTAASDRSSRLAS